MCGIVGILDFTGRFEVTSSLVEKMRDKMIHRGPDGAGSWIAPDRRVGLGHRRLSIIDLSSTANQPMSNEDGSLQVVFNGEIYNHAEIRAELKQLGGHVWITDHSDTEVILHAFEEWGIDCLQRFRGMFAFGLWDARRRELWLVRDRIGIKPLYYSLHHGRLTFASEIKALLADADQPREVNEDGLFHYLSFLSTPAPQTMFAGIKKLNPGTWLKVSHDGSLDQRCYWDVWDHVEPLSGVSDEEIADRVLAELRTAVRYRKVSDVPVGIFLSGGIDSSTNAALFADGESRPIKTFSIGYDGEYASYQNELHFARLMADQVGADHHERLLSVDDLISFLPQMVHLQDEPIGDPVCVPVYYLSELARQNGVTVCQVGEGADELFWGYLGWKTQLTWQKRLDRVPRQLAAAGVGVLNVLRRRDQLYTDWLQRTATGLPIFWSGAESIRDREKMSLFSPRLRERFRDQSSWSALAPTYQRFRERAWECSRLHWMTYADLMFRLPELLLMRVDKMSMGASLECRVPFLDHKFVELALSIPTAAKVRGGVSKAILKRAVRGIIPDQLIDRPKQGFGVPVYEWFFDRLGGYAAQELNAFCDRYDFFDQRTVTRWLEQHRGPSVWYLLNFALWCKQLH